jgi:hypothetical protein
MGLYALDPEPECGPRRSSKSTARCVCVLRFASPRPPACLPAWLLPAPRTKSSSEFLLRAACSSPTRPPSHTRQYGDYLLR